MSVEIESSPEVACYAADGARLYSFVESNSPRARRGPVASYPVQVFADLRLSREELVAALMSMAHTLRDDPNFHVEDGALRRDNFYQVPMF